MKLEEVLLDFREKRDAPFDDAVLCEWISEVNAFAIDEVISKCDVNAKPYRLDPLNDRERELDIRFPDCEIYFLYLSMKCDLTLGDYGRYNLSSTAFENAWRAYADRYFRNHMPRCVKIKTGGRLELFQGQ